MTPIEIRKIENGFLLVYIEELEEDNFITRETAFTYDTEYFDADKGEREALADALNFLIFHFECQLQKHAPDDEEFIKVKMVKHKDFFDDEN